MPAEDAHERLAELALRHGLSEAQRELFGRLLGILHGDAHAPTGVSAPERAVDVHVADALAALELGAVRAARSVADLGSGAGLPGLALAVALPAAEVSLVESQARKCAFIQATVERMELGNARAVCARVEQWPQGLGRHDLVLARALASQAVVLEYAAPLLAMGGSLVDWRGRRIGEEDSVADRAAAELGMARIEVRSVPPFPGASEHHLHVFAKVAATPQRFPRRPGIARKRPLGGRPAT